MIDWEVAEEQAEERQPVIDQADPCSPSPSRVLTSSGEQLRIHHIRRKGQNKCSQGGEGIASLFHGYCFGESGVELAFSTVGVFGSLTQPGLLARQYQHRRQPMPYPRELDRDYGQCPVLRSQDIVARRQREQCIVFRTNLASIRRKDRRMQWRECWLPAASQLHRSR